MKTYTTLYRFENQNIKYFANFFLITCFLAITSVVQIGLKEVRLPELKREQFLFSVARFLRPKHFQLNLGFLVIQAPV